MSSAISWNAGLAELGRKNQPNGYVGIDADGDVVGTFSQRVGTATEIAAITLAAGEFGYASNTGELFIGDGSTAGGLFHSSVRQQGKVTVTGPMSAAPTLGLMTSSNAVLLPRAPGSPQYEVGFHVEFSGDSGGTSNFALRVGLGITAEDWISSAEKGILTVSWFNTSDGTLIETNTQAFSVVETLTGKFVALSAANQNKTAARAIGVFQMKAASGGSVVLSTIGVSIGSRSGSSNASGTLIAWSKRQR